MRELRDAGAVRAIGLGVNEWEVCVELLGSCELDCILLAGRYTLLEQPALAQLLPLCAQRRVSVICGGPFNSGILAAGSRAGARHALQLRRAAGRRARARTPARRTVRGVRGAVAGGGAAIPARPSRDRERRRRLRKRRRGAQLRGHVLASHSRRVLARAARARPRRRARAAAGMSAVDEHAGRQSPAFLAPRSRRLRLADARARAYLPRLSAERISRRRSRAPASAPPSSCRPRRRSRKPRFMLVARARDTHSSPASSAGWISKAPTPPTPSRSSPPIRSSSACGP